MKPVYTRRVRCALILFTLGSILSPFGLSAEGTKQIMPNPNNGTGLIVSTTTTFPLGNVGAYLNCPVDDRIFIHVKDFTTETLYFGFNWETLSPATPINTYSDVYMNLYDPTGALIPGYPVNLASTAGSAGFITTYLQAIQGPQIGGAPAGGYIPLTFTPSKNGDYYVSFYRSTDGGVTHIPGGESMLSKYFDITIAQGTTREIGRVHCNEWAFSVYNPAKSDIQDPMGSTNAGFYGYTPDSVTLKVSFPSSGFEPLSYIVAFNSYGCQNTGNWENDRRSIVLTNLVPPYLTGGYMVFLNPPDVTIYPTSSIPVPPVLLDPVISGCPPGPFNIRFLAPQAGDYWLLFDLNGVAGYQPNSSDFWVELDNQVPGIITYTWNGKDGLGNQVPANTTFPITFSFRKGRINIPIYDDELNVNGFNVVGISPAGAISPNPTLYWNDTLLTNNGTTCATGQNNNNISGTGYDNSIVGVTPNLPTPTIGRAWNGNGNPTNVIPAPPVLYGGVRNDSDQLQCNDFGNARLLNTWAWGIVLNSIQQLTLTCVTVSGTVWDDADGSANNTFNNIRTNSELGTNAGATLYASMIDPISGTVVATTAVNADGTYTLNNLPVGSQGMEIVLSTLQGVIGSPAPATNLPPNWVNTSPLIHTFNAGNSNVTGIDFGIEQLPNSNNENYTIGEQVLNSLETLNGTGTAADPGPLAGSDPEDGILGNNKSVVITAVPANEQLYYFGNLVTNNEVINNYNPAALQVKWTNPAVVSTSFTYAYLDAAGRQDPTPATYTINVSVVLANTLASFTGRSTDQGNVLSWTSYDETTATNFTVQRSGDGVNYTTIGTVAGTGNNSTVNHSFTDVDPIPDVSNSYRLLWTDGNGNLAISNTVTLAPTTNSTVIAVTPNPFRDQVTVRMNLSQTEQVSIRVLDSKGAVIKQVQAEGIKGSNAIDVNGLAGLPVSVYFIQVILPDRVFVKKAFNNR
jgi:Secretion system C-terminal sorting domain